MLVNFKIISRNQNLYVIYCFRSGSPRDKARDKDLDTRDLLGIGTSQKTWEEWGTRKGGGRNNLDPGLQVAGCEGKRAPPGCKSYHRAILSLCKEPDFASHSLTAGGAGQEVSHILGITAKAAHTTKDNSRRTSRPNSTPGKPARKGSFLMAPRASSWHSHMWSQMGTF